jgi:hypothetical protein
MKPSFKYWTVIVITLLALTFSAPGVTPAHAAMLTVTNNLDSGPGSLRQAIADTASGDTITFDNDYTITLASELKIINKTVTITGAGHHITISGNNAVRVFHVGDYDTASSGNLTIDHLNIVNGRDIYNAGDPLCDGQEVACGGGLLLDYLATATVLNSTFSNNDGGIQGGAIYSYYGNPLTVTNSTFINNHALAYAGAIQVFYGSATLTNNTFTGNAATLVGGYGGAILNNWGTVTFRNNVFANNSATNGGNCVNSGGTFNENGGNLVWGDTADCPGVNANPLLGTPGDYGGGVQTIPLLPGSPAIGAANANCPSVDARGIARGATCDSGAFESQGFTLTKTGGDHQSTLFNTAFANPLTLSVTNSFGEPVNGGIVTFTAPGSGASAAISGSPATISGGAVSVSATANDTIGGPYNVTASAAGATSVNFALTNAEPTPTPTKTRTPTPIVTATSTKTNTPTLTPTRTRTKTSTPAIVTLTLKSIGAQDGWILESNETSKVGGTINSAAATFNLGDNTAKKQYRGILSFSTGAALPNSAQITAVTLRVKQQTILGGGSPVTIFQGFMADVKNGFFGATPALQTGDFQAAASKACGPFNTALVGGWYNIDLTGAKAYVNKRTTYFGLTQIRLRFTLDDNNNAIANVLSLYSGNAPAADRPQLVIKYYVP